MRFNLIIKNLSRKAWSRLFLICFAIFFSILTSLLSSYLYGLVFSHTRYWEGTIRKVENTEILLLKNLFSDSDIIYKNLDSPIKLNKLFRPLDGKLAIEVWKNEIQIYSNYSKGRIISPLQNKIITATDLTIIIRQYQPPSWNYQYIKWITNPFKWLDPSGDFITSQFTTFFLIYTILMYAIGWQIRAIHLSKDVISLINKIDQDL